MFTIDVMEEEREIGRCDCCGAMIRAGMAGVLRDGTPCALYNLRWTDRHQGGLDVRFILADDWSEDVPRGNLTVFVVRVTLAPPGFDCGHVDPENSPWPQPVFETAPLLRFAALNHPRHSEVQELTEAMIDGDPRARRALGIPN